MGYSPKVVDQRPRQTGYAVRTAGVAGSDPRSWYYLLRDLDPTARRYRAIVFGVDDYDDEDSAFNPDDDIRALHYCIVRLRLSDVIDFARSFYSPAVQWEAFRGSLLKGIALQSDIQAFLVASEETHRPGAAVPSRLAGLDLRLCGVVAQHGGPPNRLGQAEARRSLPDMTEEQRDTVHNYLLHAADAADRPAGALPGGLAGTHRRPLPQLAHQDHLHAPAARTHSAPGQPGAKNAAARSGSWRRGPTCCWRTNTLSIRWSIPSSSKTRCT